MFGTARIRPSTKSAAKRRQNPDARPSLSADGRRRRRSQLAPGLGCSEIRHCCLLGGVRDDRAPLSIHDRADFAAAMPSSSVSAGEPGRLAGDLGAEPLGQVAREPAARVAA